VAARTKAPLEYWDRGFESRSTHGYMSAVSCAVPSCVGRGLAMGRPHVQGVLPKYLKEFINTEIYSGTEQPRGPNP
jgi:hypothetical protein